MASSENGTRFTIVLPANNPDNEAAAEPDSAPTETFVPARPATVPRRVLLAEDGAVNQRLIVRLLRFAGHWVQVVNNGREAVDAWASQPFDIVLMDVEMPELDGLAAAREIRQREREPGRHTPVVALTAHASEESRAECLAAGMDAVLVKPVRQDDLDDAIRRLAVSS